MNTLHIDNNDQLKRFGFPIHRCIDGFSRKFMWLVVSTSNNDPLVIANNFFYAYRSIAKIVEQKIFIVKICKCSSLARKNHLFMQNQHEINTLNHFAQGLRNIN